MLAEVHQYVNESVTYRTRGIERTRVVSVAPDAPMASERAVHGAGEANG
jgi:hypothetical protein